jgi:RHS repeat-associated protein
MEHNSSTYYLSYNHQGSLRAVTDTNGQIIKSLTYSAYGEILSDTNPDINIPFGFAGGLYDKDTKLTRFGYRDYDSYTGKWTAKDPIRYNGGDTNLYNYVLNDPINYFDEDGQVPKGLGWNLATCTIAGATKGLNSIEACKKIVWDLYYDQINGNNDYLKICTKGPSGCALGCVGKNICDSIINECLDISVIPNPLPKGKK